MKIYNLPFDILYLISTFIESNKDTVSMVTTNKKMYTIAKKNGYIKKIRTCLCEHSKLLSLPPCSKNISRLIIDTRDCRKCGYDISHPFILDNKRPFFQGVKNLEIRSLFFTKFRGVWKKLETLKCYSSPLNMKQFSPVMFPSLRKMYINIDMKNTVSVLCHRWEKLEVLKCVFIDHIDSNNFPNLTKFVIMSASKIDFGYTDIWKKLEVLYCPYPVNFCKTKFPSIKKIYTEIPGLGLSCRFTTNFLTLDLFEN